MKFLIRHSHITPSKGLNPRVRQQILTLAPLRQIDEAIVHLAHEHEASPPFRVHVQLVTPGPDVFAEARDHTLAAALAKVTKSLAETIGVRAGKQRARLRDNAQAPSRTARGNGTARAH
jgi:ribosome-associated translation inhibitor RaiA